MISKIRKSLLPLVFSFLFVSCYGSWNFFYKGNDVDERTENPLDLNASSDSAFVSSGISSLTGKYTVLVISDVHFGSKKKTIDPTLLYSWLDNLKGSEKYPSFAICLGDVVDHGFAEEYEQYLAFCKKLRTDYGMRLILHSCGNHDIYQGHWDNWKKSCYPYTSFYKFHTSKISWYCLDTASGTIGLNQYNTIISEFHNDSRAKIIFTHYPFVRFNTDCSNMGETTERNKMISDFTKNNVRCVLGGHNHTITDDDLGYFHDYGIPSLCYCECWGLLFVDEDKEEVYLDYCWPSSQATSTLRSSF